MKWILLLVATIFVFIGCEERPPAERITVGAQIEACLAGEEISRELFRTDSLVLGDDYDMPFDAFVYRDSVMSVTRSIEFSAPVTIYYTPFDARGVFSIQIRVTDEIRVRTIRSSVAKTDTLLSTRNLLRDGWFLKTGSDADRFYGWKLWGFNGTVGTIPLDLRCVRQDSVVFDGDNELPRLHRDDFNVEIGNYVLWNELDTVLAGYNILFQAEPAPNTSPTTRYITSLSARGEFGLEKSIMTRESRNLYRDTIKTQVPNAKLWNLLYVESFRDDQFFFIKSWVIPYLVPEQ